MSKIETIFDHNVTKEELITMLGYSDYTPELFKEFSQEDNYVHIFYLYLLRKDEANSKKYLGYIPDSDFKTFTLCNHDFAI